MIHEISMPALSSTMETGKVVSWLKSPGDVIQKGENILVVESDKADMDVESFYSGILATIVVAAGESAPVGSAIALIAETDAEVEQAKQKAASLKSTSSTSKPSPAPTQPAIQPTPQPTPQPAIQPAIQSAIQPAIQPAIQSATATGTRLVASPLAKKRAAELGVDLASVIGSGPEGRIVEADVQKAASSKITKDPAVPAATPKASPPASVPLGQVVPLTTLQAAVARNMAVSLSVPTFHVSYPIVTTALDNLYKQVKPKGVTMTALLAKAVAAAIEKHPLLNACYTDAGIHYKADINIAVAVAMDDGGLITPVLQKANTIDLYELSRRWKDLVDRARLKQLQPDEYSTGSFTLSNLGMFGVTQFDAILPPNQGSILAIGAARPTVVATADGSIAVRNQMTVNITCDHRVIYGAHAAAFLQELASLLETHVASLTL